MLRILCYFKGNAGRAIRAAPINSPQFFQSEQCMLLLGAGKHCRRHCSPLLVQNVESRHRTRLQGRHSDNTSSLSFHQASSTIFPNSSTLRGILRDKTSSLLLFKCNKTPHQPFVIVPRRKPSSSFWNLFFRACREGFWRIAE